MSEHTADSDFLEAVEHQRAGRTSEAAELCNRILAADANHPRALHLLGIIQLQSGKATEAIRLLQRSIAAVPDYAEAHFNLAAMLASSGDFVGASQHYERVTALRPDHPEAASRYATTLVKLGQPREAEAFLRDNVARQPNDFFSLNVLSSLALQRGDKNEAEAFARRAVSTSSSCALSHLRLGCALREQQKFEEAEASFREALAIEPDDDLALYYLGSIFHARLEFERAAQYFQRALSLNPENDAASDGMDLIRQGLSFGTGSGFQGAHRPSRQVFMSAVVSLLRTREPPVRILEIGSYMGASAITWGRALSRLYCRSSSLLCIDLWADNRDLPYDVLMARSLESGLAYRTFLSNIATLPEPVTAMHRRGRSSSILPELESGSFDIIYIDGSHRYDDVIVDVKEATRLTRDGGFICGDDLELQASRCDMNFARQAANGDAVSDPYTGETFHPGVTLALHEVFGPVSAYDGFWLMRKSGDNYVDVSLREATAVLPTHWPRKIVEQLRARFSSRQELAGIVV